MEIELFMQHFNDFVAEFGIETTPEARYRKLIDETCELIVAHEEAVKEAIDEEALDVLICSLALVQARGIKDPLHAAFRKLEKTAEKYRGNGLTNRTAVV